ncbi:MAG: cell division protein FtsZ, partial [Saezia sp.]
AVIVQGVWQWHKASRMLQRKSTKILGDHDAEPSWEGSTQDGQSPLLYGTIGLPDAQFYTSLVDPLIDVIIELDLEQPIKGDVAISATPASRRVGSKPMYFEGFNGRVGSWEPLNRDETYARLHVALQLANRTGALNEIEFSDFVRLTQSYADRIGGAFEAPEMAEIVLRARELDQFASDHDAQLRISLVSNATAWSLSYLQQQAAELGFIAGSIPGRMVIPSAQNGAPPVLTMSYDAQAAMADDPNMIPITYATLTLDVPQTDSNEEPFKLLYKVSASLSKVLEASVVDEQGMPLNAQAFDEIYKMLETLYNQLEMRGLNAGSSATRRLFS